MLSVASREKLAFISQSGKLFTSRIAHTRYKYNTQAIKQKTMRTHTYTRIVILWDFCAFIGTIASKHIADCMKICLLLQHIRSHFNALIHTHTLIYIRMYISIYLELYSFRIVALLLYFAACLLFGIIITCGTAAPLYQSDELINIDTYSNTFIHTYISCIHISCRLGLCMPNAH